MFSTLSSELRIPPIIYGYELLAGLGIGIVIGISYLVLPQVVEDRDLGMFPLGHEISFDHGMMSDLIINLYEKAVSSGAFLQFRILGSVLGLAISSSAMNGFLHAHLNDAIGPEKLAAVLQDTALIQTFPVKMQGSILSAFARGYNFQLKILAGFAGLQILAVGLLWKTRLISMAVTTTK